MEKVKNVNTKQRQFEVMVNFMTEHPQLAKGYIKAPEAKQATNNLWKRLSEELNAAGPPMREVVGWKKVWADHKTHLKAKLRKNRMNFSGTGGGPAKMSSFTALEEAIIDLVDMNEAVDGMSRVRKFGIKNSTPTTNDTSTPAACDDTEQEVANNLNNDTSTPAACDGTEQEVANNLNCVTSDMETDVLATAPSPPRCSSGAPVLMTPRAPFNRAVQKKETLLEKQVNGQMDYHKRSLSVLQDINKNIKCLVKYKREQLDLEEKTYQLAKKKFDHEMKLSVENSKLKIAKLELKREILNLEKNLK